MRYAAPLNNNAPLGELNQGSVEGPKYSFVNVLVNGRPEWSGEPWTESRSIDESESSSSIDEPSNLIDFNGIPN